jgi:hypothetical protein
MQTYIGHCAQPNSALLALRRPSCKHARLLRIAAGQSDTAAAVTVKVPNPEGLPFEATWSIPQGCKTYTVSLKKPLGLTLTGECTCTVLPAATSSLTHKAAVLVQFTAMHVPVPLPMFDHICILDPQLVRYGAAESQGAILVESVVQGGHAAAAGVRAGDVLLATTARTQVRGCA